jgi:2'-5' RNA ligase
MRWVFPQAVQIAVALYFDPAAEAAVRAIIARLLAAGAVSPTPGQLRPHVTLAVCGGIQVKQIRPVVAEIATVTPRLPCTLASVGAFPTEEGVVFLAPNASRALIELQVLVLDALGRLGAEVSPYFQVGSWVPHCTLAVGIQRDRIAAAFGACYEELSPISGRFTQLAVVEINTGESGYSFDLVRAGGHDA